MSALMLGALAATLQLPGGRGATTTVPLPAVKSISVVGAAPRTGPDLRAPATVTGGQEVVIRVDLAAPAPCVERCGSVTMDGKASGYMPVAITATDASQIPIQRLFIPTGQTFGEGRAVTRPVATSLPVTITARSEGSEARQTALTILAPVLLSLSLDKTSVIAGDAAIATARFSGPPASPNAVRFSVQTTNSKVLAVPATVKLDTGKTAATFTVGSYGVQHDEAGQLVAMYLDKVLPA